MSNYSVRSALATKKKRNDCVESSLDRSVKFVASQCAKKYKEKYTTRTKYHRQNSIPSTTMPNFFFVFFCTIHHKKYFQRQNVLHFLLNSVVPPLLSTPSTMFSFFHLFMICARKCRITQVVRHWLQSRREMIASKVV